MDVRFGESPSGVVPVGWSSVAVVLERIMRELALFAGAGLLLGGLDDLVVDLVWIVRQTWRRLTVYRRIPRAIVATLAPPAAPGRIAVLIGAWREAGVIGGMLATACRRWGDADFRIYVGLYPDDAATVAEVAAAARQDKRVRAVVGLLPGPTTKAEALNRAWRAMVTEEAAEGWSAKAVLIHDAEDVVHAAELTIFDTLVERFDLVQLPVLPLLDPGSRWVAGHYADEFAEAHGKQLVVREALGAGLPLAGTGCAIARAALARIAAANGGAPFAPDSLTEDYELGLRLRAAGASRAFVRLPEHAGGRPVAVRGYFPATIAAAVRQKTRWLHGIAFAGWDRLGWDRLGWDRLGWGGGLAENWMRLRDRRAPLAALVLACAYAAIMLLAVQIVLGLAFGSPLPSLWPVSPLFLATTLLLGWRIAMRVVAVTRAYGWREGLRSAPRLVVGNMIAIAAAWRALRCYVAAGRRGGRVVPWDKTGHSFPAVITAE